MPESSSLRFPRWLWITPVIPLVLMILATILVLFPPRPAPGRVDMVFSTVLVIGLLALVVGLVTLVIILILRIRRRISFSQPQTWLALGLACLDVAVPISIIVILFVGLSSMGH